MFFLFIGVVSELRIVFRIEYVFNKIVLRERRKEEMKGLM